MSTIDDLLTKLKPFMTVGGAKSVDEAITLAKNAKVWTDADDKQFNALNGSANWGRTMDEYEFKTSKAPEYKKELPNAEKQNKLEAARRKIAGDKDDSTLKTVGKYAGMAAAGVGTVALGAAAVGAIASAPAWAPFAIAGGAILGLSSCSKEIQVEKSEPWKGIEINDDDTRKRFNTAVEYFIKFMAENELTEKEREAYDSLIKILSPILNLQTEDDLDNILKNIKQWKEDLEANNLSIKYKKDENLPPSYQSIKNYPDNAMGKLVQILDFLRTIESIKEN